MLTIGKWGGVYFFRGTSVRLCLGWVALTFIPRDMDQVLEEWRPKS